jgi:uncharacterized protein YkwD
MNTHPFSPCRLSSTLLSACVFVILVACGGGGGDSDAAAPAPAPAGVSGTPSTVTGSSGSTGAPGLIALDASTSCALPDFQNSLLQQINAARATARTCGSTAMPAVGPLAWNDRLFSAAARHSRDMGTNNYFSHTGLDGRSPSQRIAAEGYAWSWAGENIAAGQQTVTTVMNGWLASPGHCANIMRAEYRDVGVSCVQQNGSTYGKYWTMALARPQ